jgi:hypothetical protein
LWGIASSAASVREDAIVAPVAPVGVPVAAVGDAAVREFVREDAASVLARVKSWPEAAPVRAPVAPVAPVGDAAVREFVREDAASVLARVKSWADERSTRQMPRENQQAEIQHASTESTGREDAGSVLASVSIRQHTSAYVSIRQHTSEDAGSVLARVKSWPEQSSTRQIPHESQQAEVPLAPQQSAALQHAQLLARVQLMQGGGGVTLSAEGAARGLNALDEAPDVREDGRCVLARADALMRAHELAHELAPRELAQLRRGSAPREEAAAVLARVEAMQVLSLLALLVQRYTY